MTNLNTQYPTGLDGFFGGMADADQWSFANRNNQINQQAALQDMFMSQQRNSREQESLPVDLDYKRALTGQTKQTTRKLEDENELLGRTKDERYRAEISKLARTMQEDELKFARAQIEAMGLDPSPEAQKWYKTFLPQFKEIEQERLRIQQQGEKDENIARIRAEEMRATNAAKPPTSAGSKAPLTMEQRILSAKKATERLALLRQAAKQAELEGDMEKSAFYNALAEEQVPIANAELNNQPRPGSPNLPGMGIKSNPPIDLSKKAPETPTPTKSTKLMGAAAEDWINRAMKANKMTREQVIIEGKKIGKL